MLHSDKGQVSMEFMAYFGILLFMFVAFGPVVFNQTMKIRKRSVAIEAERLVTVLEKEVNTAVRFGDGYTRNFTLPGEISGQDYSLEVRDSSHGKVLTVKWSEGVKNRQVIASKPEGEPKPGKNTMENSGGTIVLNGG
ncbi:MAG: hypothetical protein ACLFTY_01960 [Candidatus Aenigmatarchaeota archaeon]